LCRKHRASRGISEGESDRKMAITDRSSGREKYGLKREQGAAEGRIRELRGKAYEDPLEAGRPEGNGGIKSGRGARRSKKRGRSTPRLWDKRREPGSVVNWYQRSRCSPKRRLQALIEKGRSEGTTVLRLENDGEEEGGRGVERSGNLRLCRGRRQRLKRVFV